MTSKKAAFLSHILISLFFPSHINFSDRLRADGKINVFNANRQLFPDGKQRNITGFALNPDPSEPGKYKVQFPPGPSGDCKYSSVYLI